MSSAKRILIISVLLFLFLLFFIGGPDYHAPRSYKAFWNLGHILFFFLLPLTFAFSKRLNTNYPLQGLLAMLMPLVLGIFIEMLQYGIHRIPDINDLYRNFIGGLGGLLFLLPLRKNLPKKIRRIGQTVVFLVIGLQITPTILFLADEAIARSQFPLLSGFETHFEHTRWTGDSDHRITKKQIKTGKAALRVQLTTNQYSGVGLKYFPGNWEGYGYFTFSVCNPDVADIALTLRIHDLKHTKGIQRYEDRYNRTFNVPTGWHTFSVHLDEVRQAPKERQMDMQQIQHIGFFSVRLPLPRIIYLDDIKLIPQ